MATLDSLSEFEPLAGALASPHGLLEAPRPLADGGLAYSDVTGGGVYRVAGGAGPELLLPKRRGIGGLLPHADGGLVVSGHTVLHSGPEGERELLAVDGVHGFNDMTADPAGRVLVGSMRFRPAAGESPSPSEIWRIEAEGAAEPVIEGIAWPNGIGLAPDGRRLYVSDTAAGLVLAFPYDGADPGGGETFAKPAGAMVDGLAVDELGGVWVALGAGGIARFEADGRLDGTTAAPAGFVSSLCFGGDEGRDLYVTTADNRLTPETGGTVFRARSEIAGLPVPLATV
jgi:sugar lactone lactonase YvrE